MGDISRTNTQHKMFVQTEKRKENPKYLKLLKMLCQGHVHLSCLNEFPNEGDETEFDSWPGCPTTSISDDNVEK
jgi:ribosomal protein S17